MKKSLGSRTIGFPTPLFLVGTYDSDGKPNIMAAAWAGISCSKPVCVSASLRAATHSHGAIVSRKAFTVSIASAAQVKEADYAGIASGRDVDKFAATGLTSVRSDLVDAPYVAECPVVLECTLAEQVELGLHTQFVGEVKDVKADEAVVDDTGAIDIAAAAPFLFIPGSRAYYTLGERIGDAFSVGKAFA